jgi:hypothetical protein
MTTFSTALGLALMLTACAFGVTGCGGGTPFYQTPAGPSTITVQISAAQETTGDTFDAPDVNTPSFQLNLTVK